MVNLLNKWSQMDEKPEGMFNRVQWQNGKFPSWRIIEQMTESSNVRYIVVSTTGSALGRGFDTILRAKQAFAEMIARRAGDR